MTMGPDPTIRMRSMSVRLGTCHQPPELPEQVAGVVRPRGGLGVVLHRHRRDVQASKPLERAVVQVPVRELGAAEGGLHDAWATVAVLAWRAPHAPCLAGPASPAVRIDGDAVPRRGGVAGTVRQEHAVRLTDLL